MTAVVDAVMPETVPDAGLVAWSEAFSEMFALVAGEFAQAPSRRRARGYLLGLLSHSERKNGWTIAEFAGDAGPGGMQRLLNFYAWDEDAVRDALRRYVVSRIGHQGGVLVADETGFLKKGNPVGRRPAAVLRDRREGGELPARGVPGLRRAGRVPGADRPAAVPSRVVDV